MLEDLRYHVPGRGADHDRTNVVFEDIIEAMVHASGSLTRFEETAESRFGMLLNRDIDGVISACENFKRRVNDIRKETRSSQ